MTMKSLVNKNQPIVMQWKIDELRPGLDTSTVLGQNMGLTKFSSNSFFSPGYMCR